jgi:hypothetical protein|tara:strand:- start:463 stop:708 length:246 start_codon:yes stop_codon:yes gene_type:complete
MQLKDLRKLLKVHGYKVKTQSFSHSRHGTIIRISDNQEKPSIFFGETHRQKWIEAINILSSIDCVMDGEEKILGLALGNRD